MLTMNCHCMTKACMKISKYLFFLSYDFSIAWGWINNKDFHFGVNYPFKIEWEWKTCEECRDGKGEERYITGSTSEAWWAHASANTRGKWSAKTGPQGRLRSWDKEREQRNLLSCTLIYQIHIINKQKNWSQPCERKTCFESIFWTQSLLKGSGTVWFLINK